MSSLLILLGIALIAGTFIYAAYLVIAFIIGSTIALGIIGFLVGGAILLWVGEFISRMKK